MSGIVLYWIVLVVWAAVVTYFVVFDLMPMLTGKWHPKKGSHKAAHDHQEPAPEAPPGYSVYDGFRSFADKEGHLTSEDIVKGLAREEKT